jgi:class 3 adenylate cyclase
MSIRCGAEVWTRLEVKRTSRSRAVDPMLRPYHGRLQERTMDRRLAAILAADVAGYSRLMSEDETGTLAALQAHRSEVIMPTIERHRGRIVRLMGDGILAEFGSVVEAVACATEVQHQMEVRNRGAPAPTLFSEIFILHQRAGRRTICFAEAPIQRNRQALGSACGRAAPNHQDAPSGSFILARCCA